MREVATQARGAAVRGIVLSIDDTGEAQTITVQTHDGVVRSGVPVMSIHGLASNPGADATCLLLAVGGDQSDLVALPLAGFVTRRGAMPAGGAALYDDAGNGIAFTADGNAQLAVAALLRLLVQTLTVQASAGTTFHGPVTFVDAVTFDANVTFGANVSVAGNLSVTGAITGASINGH